MMVTIGLIAAMPLESAALLRHVTDWQPITIGRLRGQRFELQEKACLMVTSGMGVQRAREAAGILVERFSPGILISFGIAGAVEADLEIGDVVLCDAFCHLQMRSLGAHTLLASWPAAAYQAASESLASRGKKLFRGTAITTGGSQLAASQLDGIAHPVLEMETAGIASLAAEKGLPLLSLRAISDGPSAPIPFDLAEMMDENANLRTDRLIKAILLHPRILFQSMRMRRNSVVAADYAALALHSALSHLPG